MLAPGRGPASLQGGLGEAGAGALVGSKHSKVCACLGQAFGDLFEAQVWPTAEAAGIPLFALTLSFWMEVETLAVVKGFNLS